MVHMMAVLRVKQEWGAPDFSSRPDGDEVEGVVNRTVVVVPRVDLHLAGIDRIDIQRDDPLLIFDRRYHSGDVQERSVERDGVLPFGVAHSIETRSFENVAI